jgi:DEAD/DEAH box helicase domain-containing protein
MRLNQLLSHWRAEPTIYANITEWRQIQSRKANIKPFPTSLHPGLIDSLSKQGINSLFIHQHMAWERAAKRKNVIIATGTASGKTLAYNLPILDTLLCHEGARALYIFPTKALAQDQLNELQEVTSDLATFQNLNPSELRENSQLENLPIPIAVYDGDTQYRDRATIREIARVVITNPDMLHIGILPHHTQWAEFFSKCKFIVIDEIHVYRGVFGSHVANVIRRLKRIAQFYGSNPQFFLTSATIANPVELGEKLIEEPVELVDQDGSDQGPRNFIIYNPPIVDHALGIRRSSLLESVRLAEDLIHFDIQTIIFGRSRRSIELILTYLRQSLLSQHKSSDDEISRKDRENKIIRGYRSGYLPAERRAIERGLRTGDVRAVVATNALELGIDIGAMGASVIAGYPGTIASTWQQAGRAGRGDDPSLVLLIASASPMDQFLAHNPEYFFARSPEKALINPDNLLILLAHIRCALFELPFEDEESFGDFPREQLLEIFDLLLNEGLVHKSGSKHFWMADHYPAENISLRVASPKRILLQISAADKWVTIGEVDYESGPWLVHPNAIYLQESQMYRVEELNLEKGFAHLVSTSTDYYTQPRINTIIELIDQTKAEEVSGGVKSFGELLVTTQVTGYKQIRWFTHEQLGFGELDLPAFELNTMGYWLAIKSETVEQLREKGLWSNDPNQYGSSWKEQKDLTRARDDYICQVCGVKETDRAHDVHHITPFRQFSSPLNANKLSNLITLCPSCHRRAESSVRLRSGLSGLAHLLSHIAPIFLMCDVRDLGVYSDPQSPLADGNPAIVLYERIPAGIGFSQRLFEIHRDIISNANQLVNNCQCIDGCPSCVGPAGENGSGGKQETLALIELLNDNEKS